MLVFQFRDQRLNGGVGRKLMFLKESIQISNSNKIKQLAFERLQRLLQKKERVLFLFVSSLTLRQDIIEKKLPAEWTPNWKTMMVFYLKCPYARLWTNSSGDANYHDFSSTLPGKDTCWYWESRCLHKHPSSLLIFTWNIYPLCLFLNNSTFKS